MAWLTPKTPDGYCVVSIIVPNEIGYIASIAGAILPLSKIENWEIFGSVEPDEAAQGFSLAMTTMTTDCVNVIVDANGDVIKDSSGKWIIEGQL